MARSSASRIRPAPPRSLLQEPHAGLELLDVREELVVTVLLHALDVGEDQVVERPFKCRSASSRSRRRGGVIFAFATSAADFRASARTLSK